MRRAVGIGVLFTVLLGALILAGGGIYHVVSLGYGKAYIVNRFTGRAYPLVPPPQAPEQSISPRRDPAAEAIDLVKREPASKWFRFDAAEGLQWMSATDTESVEDYYQRVLGHPGAIEGRMRVLGWKADRQPDGLYVVSLPLDLKGKIKKGIGWEVDTEHHIVRAIGRDSELAKHYGFKYAPAVQ
jgi:hypothetical protein